MNACEFAVVGTVTPATAPALGDCLTSLCGEGQPFTSWERHFIHRLPLDNAREQETLLRAVTFTPEDPVPQWRLDCLGDLAHRDRSRSRVRNVYSSFLTGDVTRFLQNLDGRFQYECVKEGTAWLCGRVLLLVYRIHAVPSFGAIGRRTPLHEDSVVECLLTAPAEAPLETEAELLAVADHLKQFVRFTKDLSGP